MAEVTARERFECPACGGAAEWSPAKQALVCPFCGTVSPMQPGAAAEGAVKEHDLVAALRAIPRKRARLADRDALREVPELPGDLRLQARTRRADLRLLRLARARSLRRNQGADPPGERAAVQDQSGRGARKSARLVSQPLVCAEPFQEPRLHRHHPRALPALLDLRRAGRRAMDRRGRLLLLHDRDLPRLEGKQSDPPGAARPLGIRERRARSFLRRRTGARLARRAGGVTCAGSSLSRPKN